MTLTYGRMATCYASKRVIVYGRQYRAGKLNYPILRAPHIIHQLLGRRDPDKRGMLHKVLFICNLTHRQYHMHILSGIIIPPT